MSRDGQPVVMDQVNLAPSADVSRGLPAHTDDELLVEATRARLDDDSARFILAARRRTRRTISALWLGAGLLALTAWGGARLSRWARGEIDVRGNQVYRPSQPADGQALGRTDLPLVHGRLIPAWAAALSARPASSRSDRSAARLLAAVYDPDLRGLLTELHELARRGRPHDHIDRIAYLTWAYNAYLARAGQPFELGTRVHAAPHPALEVLTYRVLATLEVRVGAGTHPVRLLQRMDASPEQESHVGRTTLADGSTVILDRIYDFAADRVWPLLDPSASAARQDRPAAILGGQVRSEARRALQGGHLAILSGTAAARGVIAGGIRRINSRRSCGSALWILAVPFDGFTAGGQDLLRSEALAGAGADCPGVTEAEALRLVAASRELTRARGLREALGGLTAWVARAVIIHEARHAADAPLVFGGSLPCDGCPPELGLKGRAELAAYLAGIGAADLGGLNLFQACLSLDTGLTGEGQAALRFLDRMLGQACRKGPPRLLYHRAAWLEGFFFRRADRILLPPDFPEQLTVPDRCRGGAACWGSDSPRASGAGALYATWRGGRTSPAAAPADLRRDLHP